MMMTKIATKEKKTPITIDSSATNDNESAEMIEYIATYFITRRESPTIYRVLRSGRSHDVLASFDRPWSAQRGLQNLLIANMQRARGAMDPATECNHGANYAYYW